MQALTLERALELRGQRSVKTGEAYRRMAVLFAKSVGAKDPGTAFTQIGEEELYEFGSGFAAWLQKRDYAPKTIWAHVGQLKKLLLLLGRPLNPELWRIRVSDNLPKRVVMSSDRIPTREESRRLMSVMMLKGRALYAVLLSSGIRLGEADQLTVGMIDFKRKPTLIRLPASITKTRKTRVTFVSEEATELLKTYLGQRIRNTDERVFAYHGKRPGDCAYNLFMRAVKRANLKSKTYPESRRYEIHPHVLRKAFKTNLVAAGLDRGVVEYLAGGEFAQDNAYLRMSEEQLARAYTDKMWAVTVFSPAASEEMGLLETKAEAIKEENEELRQRLTKLEGQFETILKAKLKDL